MRSPPLLRGIAALATTVTGLCITNPALAAAPLLFPTSRNVVPFAVAGAFVLPSLVAVLFVTLSRLGRVLGPVVGICVLAATALVLIGFTKPEFLAAISGWKAG